MKLVALHTDFRIYWPARLKALNDYLKDKNWTLEVVEISGKGSPYSFDNTSKSDDISWYILFPDSKPEELSGKNIKSKLFKLLDSLNPDVILAGAIAFPSGALAVQWANSRPNKRVVVFDDAKINAVKRNWLINYIKQSVYNGVDAMFYPAEPWVETGEFWKFNRKEMFFGIDVVNNAFWSENVKDKPFKFKYFVAIGRQIPKKNYFTIVRAFHKYYNSVPNDKAFRLLLIGNGPEHKRICDYIAENQLDKVIICHDFMSQQELRAVYHHANVLCCNSNSSETWGLVINEAMCGGCAIIASRECGATDVLVQEEINGYKTQCHDIDDLATAMLRYHNLTASQKEDMGVASRKIIAHWGLNRFCEGAYSACKYVIAHPKRKVSILSRFVISNWNGRYRPV